MNGNKIMRRKVHFIVKCIDCGKPKRILDYPEQWERWTTGNHRCHRCVTKLCRERKEVRE